MKYSKGRPSLYGNNEKGLQLFKVDTEKYIDDVKRGLTNGNSTAWAEHLGTTRQTLATYKKRGATWKGYIDITMNTLKTMR